MIYEQEPPGEPVQVGNLNRDGQIDGSPVWTSLNHKNSRRPVMEAGTFGVFTSRNVTDLTMDIRENLPMLLAREKEKKPF